MSGQSALHANLQQQNESFIIVNYYLFRTFSHWFLGCKGKNSFSETLDTWKSENSKFDEFGPFFAWKIVCVCQNHIFEVKLWKIFASKNKSD
jgi:hypothetical protein